jgi:uncharacterized membrane protein
MTVGIIWINHHAMFSRLARVDHSILILNLLLLLVVAALPFTTSLMATYLKEGHGENLAAAIYAGSFFVMGYLFGVLNRHILIHRAELLKVQIPAAARRRALRFARLGQVPYLVATLLAFVSPYLSIAICAACGIYYSLPIASRADQSDAGIA